MKSRHSPASPGSWDGKDLLWNQCQERGIGSFPNFSSLLVPWFFNVYIYFNFFFFFRDWNIFFPSLWKPFPVPWCIYKKIRDHGVRVVIPDVEPWLGNDFIKMRSRPRHGASPDPQGKKKNKKSGKGGGGKTSDPKNLGRVTPKWGWRQCRDLEDHGFAPPRVFLGFFFGIPKVFPGSLGLGLSQ